jgi:hypothetical protein
MDQIGSRRADRRARSLLAAPGTRSRCRHPPGPSCRAAGTCAAWLAPAERAAELERTKPEPGFLRVHNTDRRRGRSLQRTRAESAVPSYLSTVLEVP